MTGPPISLAIFRNGSTLPVIISSSKACTLRESSTGAGTEDDGALDAAVARVVDGGGWVAGASSDCFTFVAELCASAISSNREVAASSLNTNQCVFLLIFLANYRLMIVAREFRPCGLDILVTVVEGAEPKDLASDVYWKWPPRRFGETACDSATFASRHKSNHNIRSLCSIHEHGRKSGFGCLRDIFSSW